MSHDTIAKIVEAAAAAFQEETDPATANPPLPPLRQPKDLPRFTDEELMGLTAVVNAETCQRDAANSDREAEGKAMAYDDSIPWPALEALTAELKRRKVLP